MKAVLDFVASALHGFVPQVFPLSVTLGLGLLSVKDARRRDRIGARVLIGLVGVAVLYIVATEMGMAASPYYSLAMLGVTVVSYTAAAMFYLETGANRSPTFALVALAAMIAGYCAFHISTTPPVWLVVAAVLAVLGGWVGLIVMISITHQPEPETVV